MKDFLKVLLLLVAYCLVFSLSQLDHRPIQIINGSTVDPPHSLPYQVLLIMGSDPIWDIRFCGGALISEEWVLTSGNCTYNALASVCEAYVGSQNITNSEGEDGFQFSFVTDYITHHDFDPDTLGYNIGLVHLTTPVVFNNTVKPVDLPFKNQTIADLVGKSGIISGWGSSNISDMEQITFVLQSAQTTIIADGDDAECTESNTDLDLYTSICAKSEKNAHIYGTDFGGPLVVDGKLVGISSVWTGVDGDLDLFTNVHFFLEWISEITGIPIN